MKHFAKILFAALLALLMCLPVLPVMAADGAFDHQPYWALQKAYSNALNSQNPDPDEIAAACEAIISFYSDLVDKTACDRVNGPIQKAIAIYEEQGRYDEVLRLHETDQRVYLRKCELTGTAVDPHRPYWVLQKVYGWASVSGDPDAIAAACEDIITFYRDLWDKTACDRVSEPIRTAMAIYEEQGRTDDVLRLQAEEDRVYLRKCELTGETPDPHRHYWKLQKAYTAAQETKDPDKIAAACEAIIAFYRDLWDRTACDRVITPILQAAKIYEEQGRFDDALRLYREYQRCYQTLGRLTDEDVSEPLKYAGALIDAYAYTDPEIYVYANKPADVPDYGAKNEPHAGTYTGMCGYYEKGLCNAHLLYVQFETEYARQFAYLLPKTDEYRLQEIAWNTPAQYNEDGAIEYFTRIADGAFDTYIIDNLRYMNSLENCGILLRFGAEINEWGVNEVYAKEGRLEEFKAAFKAAFRRIHDLAEIHAPKVAMVYSPNDISNMYVSHADFYPGDDCVDWVGMSSYGNRSASGTGSFGSKDDAYYKRGVYANQLIKIKDIVDTYGDRKPIMISECGFMYQSDKSEQTEAHAKERLQYFYSYINMLYPQVKAVFYFNTNFNGNYYCLFSEEKEHNDTVAAAYREVLRENSTIRETLGGQEGGYTRLSTLCEKREDLTLSLYAAFPGNPSMTVTYTLDGKQLAQTAAAPYTVHIGAELLQEGRHTLSVRLQVQKTTVVEDYILYVSSDGVIRTEEPDMTDVAQDWSHPYISYCLQEGFFDGMTDSAFEPKKQVTRAAFVTLLGRAAGIDPADYGAPEFSDVPANADYAPYVTWAKEAGVTAGTGDGTVFSPDMIISREQICTMLIRYCDKVGIALPASDGSKFIDDTEIDSWAQDGVYRAKTAGIVSGRGENRFDPNALLTRQEIAVILKNFHLGFIRAN